jgi:hypothetical protein
MTDFETTEVMKLLRDDPESKEVVIRLMQNIKEGQRFQGEFDREATLKFSLELAVRYLNKAKEFLVVDSIHYSALSQELENALAHCQNAISYLNESPEQ